MINAWMLNLVTAHIHPSSLVACSNLLLHGIPTKLPRRHIPVKQQVQLLVRPAPRLGHAEIRPHQTQPGQPAKEEAQFPLQVSLLRVDEVRDRDGHDDAEGPLGGGGGGNGLGADARGRALGEQDEADGADGDVVEEVPAEHDGRLGPCDRVGAARDAVEDADDELQEHQESEAVDEERSAAEAEEQTPGGEGAHESDSYAYVSVTIIRDCINALAGSRSRPISSLT